MSTSSKLNGDLNLTALTSTLLLFCIAASPIGAEQSPDSIPRSERGWLAFGFHLSNEDSAESTARFLAVHKVLAAGPADVAGLKVGDVITHIDDESINFADSLEAIEYFARIRPGQKLRFRISRAKEATELKLTASEMPKNVFDRWQKFYRNLRALDRF